jgi:hypothetical protein
MLLIHKNIFNLQKELVIGDLKTGCTFAHVRNTLEQNAELHWSDKFDIQEIQHTEYGILHVSGCNSG